MKIIYDPNASFELVFKIQETCNINCSYCYMYNLGNEAHTLVENKQSPDEVWRQIGVFIIREFSVREPRYVRIVLHGGEPMLMKAATFDRKMKILWDLLSAELSIEQLKKVSFSIQTNGMLVTEAWKESLVRWKVSTGVSIDGPAEVHDRQRIDKKGRGTHARVLEGLSSLASFEGLKSNGLGGLCVIDHTACGRSVYRHLADETELGGFNFLFPFMNWDTYDQSVVDGVSRFLVAAFQEWCSDLKVGRYRNVRVFHEAIHSLQFLQQPSWIEELTIGHDVVVIESNGTVMTEESLRPTYRGFFTSVSIGDLSMEQLRALPQFQQVAKDTYSASDECFDCALFNACRSGSRINRVGMRYSSKDEELRKSVFCSALIELYTHAAAFLRLNPSLASKATLEFLSAVDNIASEVR